MRHCFPIIFSPQSAQISDIGLFFAIRLVT
jgi:hypothetical protein